MDVIKLSGKMREIKINTDMNKPSYHSEFMKALEIVYSLASQNALDENDRDESEELERCYNEQQNALEIIDTFLNDTNSD